MERCDMRTANTLSHARTRCLYATQGKCVWKLCVRHGVCVHLRRTTWVWNPEIILKKLGLRRSFSILISPTRTLSTKIAFHRSALMSACRFAKACACVFFFLVMLFCGIETWDSVYREVPLSQLRVSSFAVTVSSFLILESDWLLLFMLTSARVVWWWSGRIFMSPLSICFGSNLERKRSVSFQLFWRGFVRNIHCSVVIQVVAPFFRPVV